MSKTIEESKAREVWSHIIKIGGGSDYISKNVSDMHNEYEKALSLKDARIKELEKENKKLKDDIDVFECTYEITAERLRELEDEGY